MKIAEAEAEDYFVKKKKKAKKEKKINNNNLVVSELLNTCSVLQKYTKT